MVLIPVMEEFDNILKGITELVNAMEKNQYNFRDMCILHIKQLEDRAQKYSLPIQPKLSSFRGRLIAGFNRTELSKTCTRKELKNIENKYYLSQITDSMECVEEYFLPYRKTFDECEQLCCQVITNSVYKGALITLNECYIKNLKDGMMSFVMADEELAPVMIHIAGMVGRANMEIIFDKTLSLAGIYGKIN
ncbi:MAG: hypothetical protein PUF12_11550 [Thermoflexaceae bacterium]|nr:hypothetical protein [Thermoflexaceae bacterium]